MITKHLKVYGKVQGVGFRYGTVRLAEQYKVTGTVENVDDFVEIFVTGNIEQLDGFIQKVIAGPTPFAKVHSYDLQQIDERPFDRFTQK